MHSVQTTEAIDHRQAMRRSTVIGRQRRLSLVVGAIAATGAFAVVSALGAAWPSDAARMSVHLQLSNLTAKDAGATPGIKGIPVVVLTVAALDRSAGGALDASGSATVRVKAGAYLFCIQLPDAVIPPGGLETVSAGWYCRPGGVQPGQSPFVDLGAATGSGS
jgi:hypothetical protein